MLVRPNDKAPRQYGGAAQLKAGVKVAIKRSGMQRDDRAFPAHAVVLDAALKALAVRVAATQSVSAVINGAVPEAPANVNGACKGLTEQLEDSMDGSGLEGDVVNVFLQQTFESSLAIIQSSYRLHLTARNFSLYRQHELGATYPAELSGIQTFDDEEEPRPAVHPRWWTAPNIASYMTLVFGSGIAAALFFSWFLHAFAPAAPTLDPAVATAAADPFWRVVLTQNDPEKLRQRCLRNLQTQEGRGACQIGLWIDKPAEGAP